MTTHFRNSANHRPPAAVRPRLGTSAIGVACATLLLTALTIPAPASALDLNGFLPGNHRGNVAWSFTGEGYDEFYRARQRVSNPGVGEVETQSLSLWLDWGLTDDLALVGNVSFIDTSSDGTGGFGDEAVQDLELLLKYRFANFRRGSVRHNFLAAAGVRTPLSDYPANVPVDVGDGTTDGLFRLVYQLEAGRLYFSQQLGFDLRGGDAPDGFPLYTELGYTTGSLTWSTFFCKLMADGGTDIGDPGFTFPSNQEEYERVGLKLYARFGEKVGLSLLAFDTLDGRNTGDISGVSIGANFRL